jgi:hypothetical protein
MAKKEKNTIDMPEVSDIPGQEHIRPPRLGELADETSNVSREERADLASAFREGDGEDEATLRTGLLDSTDDDGTPLNEKSFGEGRNDDLSADDLDVPGAHDDVPDEMPGEEDEENEDYSISKNDDDTDINPDL